MSTEIKPIKKGQVFIFESEALPLHSDSDFFVENARVVPDEVNFFTCLTNYGKYALHESEMYQCVKAKNEHGEIVNVIKNEYSFVRATQSNGNYVFFTSEEAAERNNYKFSFRLGKFHDANCSEFYGDEKLLNYHTLQDRIDKSKLLNFHNDNDEWLVGVEVEKVDRDKQQEGDAWKILTETGWSKERDGSLGSNGYELVSPIMPLFDNERIERATTPVTNWINGKSNEDCGGHITISKKGLTSVQLLESFKHFVPILYSLYPNRLNNDYCRAKQWSKYFSYPERKQAFNIKDGSYQLNGRVEMRLFGRIINQKTLNWRLELIRMLINDGGNLNQFAQKIGCQESIFYKHFSLQYKHEQIGEKLQLIDRYSKLYGTHKNGISPSVKKRINNTMGYSVFTEVE